MDDITICEDILPAYTAVKCYDIVEAGWALYKRMDDGVFRFVLLKGDENIIGNPAGILPVIKPITLELPLANQLSFIPKEPNLIGLPIESLINLLRAIYSIDLAGDDSIEVMYMDDDGNGNRFPVIA